MEKRGIISGYAGSKPREVLMSKERWQELNMSPNVIPEKIENVKNKFGKLQAINNASENLGDDDEF
jgi:hypothetical protein